MEVHLDTPSGAWLLWLSPSSCPGPHEVQMLLESFGDMMLLHLDTWKAKESELNPTTAIPLLNQESFLANWRKLLSLGPWQAESSLHSTTPAPVALQKNVGQKQTAAFRPGLCLHQTQPRRGTGDDHSLPSHVHHLKVS